MKISEIEIVLIKPNKGLLGFSSFVINDEFYFSSIGIHQKLDGGFRLTYPTKNGINLFHPLNR
jgi:stage V sporulation protein G